MIRYDTKGWFTLIFRFHKSDTFRILFSSMLIVGLYSWSVAYIQIEIYSLDVKNTTALHTLLGFILSLLLVFRTNTAYDRWWEGRRAWGELVNNSRNFALKIKSFSKIPAKEKQSLGQLVYLFAVILKDHLRDAVVLNDLKNFEGKDFSPAKEIQHVPIYISGKIYQAVNKLYATKKISGDELFLIAPELRSLMDVCGICERIKFTPIPYSYSLFLKKFIFVYIMTFPLGFVSVFGYWVIPVSVFIFYVLVSLELIAEEIEDPFGADSNDLPLNQICLKIKSSIQEIFFDKANQK